MVTVTLDQMQALAAALPETPLPAATNGGGHFDIEGWIRRHGLDIAREGHWGDGGQRWILRHCPWNPDHTNLSAYIVQRSSGALAAGCHHDGCTGKGWHDLRDVVEPGWRERRATFETKHGSSATEAKK